MKTVMLCPTAHLCFSRNLFLVGGLRVHHSSHVESFLFYIFWSNQNFIFEKTENRKMKQNRGGAGGVKLAEEVGSKKKKEGSLSFYFVFPLLLFSSSTWDCSLKSPYRFLRGMVLLRDLEPQPAKGKQRKKGKEKKII